MADTEVTISVPQDLQKLSQAVIDGVKSYKAGATWQTVGMAALPVVLAEFGDFDELKAEFSDANLVPWAGAALGGIVGVFLAKATTTFLAKRKEKLQAKVPQIHAADGAQAAHEVAPVQAH